MATQRRVTKADTLLAIATGFRNFQKNKKLGKIEDAKNDAAELKFNLEKRKTENAEAELRETQRLKNQRFELDKKIFQLARNQQEVSQNLAVREDEDKKSAMARLLGGQSTRPPVSQQAALEALPPGQLGPVDTGVSSPTTTSPSIRAILDANLLKVDARNIPGTIQREGAELDIKLQQAELNKLQGETSKSADLSQFDPQKVLNARGFIADRFGAVMARNNQVVLGALQLEKQGKTFDNIDDAIRASKISPEFLKSPIRAAFNSVAVIMPAGQREQLEHVIDQRLEAGDEIGAQKELMSGIVKQMGATAQKEFRDRQVILASLSEIQQGLNALEGAGITLGPGVAIENWLKEKGRLKQTQAVTRIIQKMRNIFILFRKQISGVAYGEAENEQLQSIFPQPSKNLNMNKAILDALISTNLQNGRNSITTVAPSLLQAVSQNDLNTFLTGSVNPPEESLGLKTAFLSQDQRDNIIVEARAQLTAGKTPEEITTLLRNISVPENEINEILQSIGAR